MALLVAGNAVVAGDNYLGRRVASGNGATRWVVVVPTGRSSLFSRSSSRAVERVDERSGLTERRTWRSSTLSTAARVHRVLHIIATAAL
jgi:hypothetical protein